MNVLLFLFFSSLEWFSLIILSFALFKFEIRWYRGQIVLSAFLLSLLSYILFEVLNLTAIASLLQPPIVFLFFWQIFRVALFYAGLMAINGYLGYVVVNALVFNVFRIFDIMLVPGTQHMYEAQAISAFIALVLSWLVHKYRIGFTFVPHGDRANVKLSGINLRLLLFTIVGYIVISSVNYLYFLGDYTFLFLLVAMVALALLQYWVFRREYSDDH
ncbi:hypothetical protein FE783_13295 [Paenibacillus mesophilus]|uniref:hypothetical protein n=1 Tax=Paenibacillus mesophilus TaxID=2582849 RepID=UPI00110EE5B0|nr:hypothetical protein [Paenibacillus mesophilus]TMV49478.1 hypothetical protein FE783_13295 [Paenibacillus mesophilus]